MQSELHVQCNIVKQMPGGIRIMHIGNGNGNLLRLLHDGSSIHA